MQYLEAFQQWIKKLAKLGLAFLQYFEPTRKVVEDEQNAVPAEPVPGGSITSSEPQQIADVKSLVAEINKAVAERDWVQADLKAATLRNHDPLNRTGWLMGSVVLREMRRFDEAEALLRERLAAFPDDRQILEGFALLAQVRRDLPEAVLRWQSLVAAVPDHLAGHQGLISALRESKQFDDAEAALSSALANFPSAIGLMMEKGRLASSRRDWIGAAEAWQEVAKLKPDGLQPKLEIADILLNQKKYDEAAALLAAASQRFPDNVEIGIRDAQLVSRRRDWQSAKTLWQKLDASFPNNLRILGGLAEAFWATKDEESLVPTLHKLMALQPDNVVATILFARYEMWKNRATDAVSRLEAACRKLPDNRMLLATLSDARLQALATDNVEDAGPMAQAAATTPPAREYNSENLFEQFESLGGGCEFGLVQRQFGAEPLGLLRWASISLEGLTSMLEARFAGVGNIAQTSIHPDGQNYALIDRLYNFGMQTFISITTEDEKTLLPKLCNRQKFLARKFIEDLENADRIFVYKSVETFEDDDVFRLWTALRSYGNNALLVARLATADHSPGSLQILEDGLMIGFVSRFSNTDIAVEDWNSICAEAMNQWNYSRQHAETLAAENAWA